MPAEGVAKFRPRARLISILGNELIRNEVIAVVELAKNAYDADASWCDVRMDSVTNKARGYIEVRDDGIGMTKDKLLSAWLEPARDNKTDEKTGERPKTAKGRLPLGEKGVGRFATDKLGEDLEIVSRAEGTDIEVRIFIEGGLFSREKYLDEIDVKWSTSPAKEFLDPPHGTVLKMRKLRADWSREMVEQVHLGLAGLSSPISGSRDFTITLHSNQFPELTGKILNPLLPLAHYRMEGTVDENGVAEYRLDEGDHQSEDLRIDDERFSSQPPEQSLRKPACGPFRFAFYVWDKDPTSMKRVGMDNPKRELLQQLSGVRIYRDGFRVWPYGEVGDDWLDLNKRRVQNPGMRVGTDRIIGYIEIRQDRNPYLRDKTNREGLIEQGYAFGDLKSLVLNALRRVEEHRFSLIPHLSRAKLPKMVDVLSDIRREFQAAPEFLRALNRIEKLYSDDVELYQDRIDNLLTIAGIGMTAERLTHEFAISAQLAATLVDEITERVRSGKADVIAILRDLKRVSDQLKVLQDLVAHLEPLYYSRRSAVAPVDLQKAAEDVHYLFSKSLSDAHIDMEVRSHGKLVVNANRGHLLQVFVNLLDNSIYWLKHYRTKNPKVIVEVRKAERRVIFADNGPGIADRDVELVFEPFYTRKKDGRGLGLFIAREVLSNYQAKIDLLLEDKILPGANFVIQFAKEDNSGH